MFQITGMGDDVMGQFRQIQLMTDLVPWFHSALYVMAGLVLVISVVLIAVWRHREKKVIIYHICTIYT